MTTIVKAASAAEFLSLVPRLLGFHASQSAVLVPFEGKRTLGALRVDLPAADVDVDRFAATLVGMVCRLPTADGVALVAYASGSAEGGLPHRSLADAVARRTASSGLRLVDALCVADDGWGSYSDADVARPLTELGDAVPHGLERLPEPADGLEDGLRLAEVDASEMADAEQAMAALERAVDVVCGPGDGDDRGSFGERRPGDERIDPRALVASLLLDDLPQLYEDALEWDAEHIDPHEGAALIWCLRRPALRDIALVGWSGHVRDADEALQAQLRWEQGAEYPAHLAMRMWGDGARPEPARLIAALSVVRALASRTRPRDRAPLLAMCGWLSWTLGRSTHAAHYADQARRIEPEHGLAEIVLSFVGAGHLPEWAFDRRPESASHPPTPFDGAGG
ncbi:DUF4192 family protein [Microbacter sp. GSS18]|nr:DUF4192 family protein [Microbacter sp. GSS18]